MFKLTIEFKDLAQLNAFVKQQLGEDVSPDAALEPEVEKPKAKRSSRSPKKTEVHEASEESEEMEEVPSPYAPVPGAPPVIEPKQPEPAVDRTQLLGHVKAAVEALKKTPNCDVMGVITEAVAAAGCPSNKPATEFTNDELVRFVPQLLNLVGAKTNAPAQMSQFI